MSLHIAWLTLTAGNEIDIPSGSEPCAVRVRRRNRIRRGDGCAGLADVDAQACRHPTIRPRIVADQDADRRREFSRSDMQRNQDNSIPRLHS